MAITVTTLKAHTYAGRRRKPGDTYEVRGRSDLAVVKALGWAGELPPAQPPVASPAPPQASRTYRTTHLEAATEESSSKPRRTYQRRDQVARQSDDALPNTSHTQDADE